MSKKFLFEDFKERFTFDCALNASEKCVDSILNRNRDALNESLSVDDYRLLSCSLEAFSKYAPSEGNPVADQAGLKKFLKVNNRTGNFNVDWLAADVNPSDPSDLLVKQVFQLCKKELSYTFGDFALIDLKDKMDIGPGSSIGAMDTSFLSKLGNGELSVTSRELYRLYKALIVDSPLADVDEHRRYGLSKQYMVAYEQGMGPLERHHSLVPPSVIPFRLVEGNSLFYVPKTSDISRVAATEPLVNMLIQKAIGSYLKSTLKERTGIDINRQQVANRALAKVSSLTGDFVTIDLSSASDTIGVRLLEHLLPPDLYHTLMGARSPVTVVNDRGKKKVVKLNMMGTMGNGFTFELETALFTHIIIAVYKVLNIEILPPIFGKGDSVYDVGNFSVFGDDIIVTKEASQLILRVLTSFGLVPNLNKSCLRGRFYESCGADYLRGKSVRSLYFRRLETSQDLIGGLNKIIEFAAKYGYTFNESVAYLLDCIPPKDKLFCPSLYAEDSAIRITEEYLPAKYYRRRKPSIANKHGWWVFEVFRAQPFKYEVPDWVINHSSYGNIPIWVLSILRGEIKGNKVSLRQPNQSSVDYKLVTLTTPSWSGVSSLLRDADNSLDIMSRGSRLQAFALSSESDVKRFWDRSIIDPRIYNNLYN